MFEDFLQTLDKKAVHVSKTLSYNPTIFEVFKVFLGDMDEWQGLRKIVQLKQQQLKRLPRQRCTDDERQMCVKFFQKFNIKGWNLMVSQWATPPDEKGYFLLPNVMNFYRVFKDSQMKLNLLVLDEELWMRFPPMVFTTHFLCRYRERHIGNMSMSLDKVAEYLVREDILGRVTQQALSGKPYGCQKDAVVAVKRLSGGICYGYYSMDDGLIHLDTFISDSMLRGSQNWMKQESWDKLLESIEESDTTGYKKMAFVENNRFVEASNEQLKEFFEAASSEEVAAEAEKLLEKERHRNQLRWKKKHGTFNFTPRHREQLVPTA